MADAGKNQSSNKVIIGVIIVVVLVLVGVGAYRAIRKFNRMQTASNTIPTSQSQLTGSTAAMTPTSTAMNTNTSNAQLDQDLQNIQTQLNQLNSDQNSVAQSIQNQSNDTPQQ